MVKEHDDRGEGREEGRERGREGERERGRVLILLLTSVIVLPTTAIGLDSTGYRSAEIHVHGSLW